MYENYRKEIASRMTIHARSAIPRNPKRNILTQEVIRILTNFSGENKVRHLESLSIRMQFSVHDKNMRNGFIESGLKAYRILEKYQKEGVVPIHRTREWKKKRQRKN